MLYHFDQKAIARVVNYFLISILNSIFVNSMVEGEDYIKTPSGDMFVTRKHRTGLLAQILEELLTARKRAKQELKNETDPFKYRIL